jgi:tetratricopeptide (TPR) repeat protein
MKSKEELLKMADSLQYSELFEELDTMGLNSQAYNRLRKEFILRGAVADIDWNERLKVLINTLPDTDSNEEIEKIPSKPYKKWALIGFFGLCFLSFLGFFTFTDYCWCGTKGLDHFVWGKSKFSPCDTTYRVLIMPFTPDNCELKDDVATKIKRRLDELNETENLGIKSYLLDNYNPTSNFPDSAEYIRELHNASMIVHGYYSKEKDQCNSDNAKKFCFYWQMDSTKQKTPYDNVNLDLARNGKLQGDMETVIFWIAGNKNVERGNYAQALRHFLYLQDSLKEETATLKFYIAYCYSNQNQFENAKKYWDQFSALDSNYVVDRGEVYQKLQKYELAYSKMIEINPNNAKAYYNRGLLYKHLEKYELALADYNKTIEINPNLAEAYCNRGLLYRHLRKYKLALNDYNKTIEINPNLAEAYYNRGLLYKHLEKYDLALADYNKTIEINPNVAEVYNNRGTLYYDLQKYELALADFNKVIEINPNDAKAYYNRAILKFYQLKDKSACEDARKAKALGYQSADLEKFIREYCQ